MGGKVTGRRKPNFAPVRNSAPTISAGNCSKPVKYALLSSQPRWLSLKFFDFVFCFLFFCHICKRNVFFFSWGTFCSNRYLQVGA